MATVGDIETCEQCGYPEAAQEFDCGALEFWVLCPRCGYHYTEAYHEERVEKPGYGAYMTDNGACVSHGRLDETLTAAQLALWDQQEGLVFLTRWNPETRAVELVRGAFPEDDPEEDA